MRILIVGSNLAHAIERHFIKYLREAGVEVSVFTAPDMAAAGTRSFIRKILFRTGLKTGYRGINIKLLQEVEKFNPDIVWVFKGMEIYPRTLQAIKRKGIKLANYNPDHPFIIAGRGSGNANVTNAVGLYDLHFCYHSGLMEKIKQQYNIPSVFLPFGYELPEEVYATAIRQPETDGVCFVGSPDKIRIRLISLIADNGFPVDIFGNRWNKKAFASNPNVTVYPEVLGQEFWNRTRQYRLQLNAFRKHNIGSHNMRTIEVPAVGGILLTPYSEEQALFFDENQEVFFFRDEQDLVEAVKKIMAMSTEEISVIRTAARSKSLAAKNTYADRTRTVMNAFNRLMNASLLQTSEGAAVADI